MYQRHAPGDAAACHVESLLSGSANSVSLTSVATSKGRRQPLKTEESRCTVELPRELARMLADHGR
jgi:hypothetical protein